MLFRFLKYLQPTHYFQRLTKAGISIFPKADELPADILNQLHRDAEYLSKEAVAYDLSWQAIQLGYIGNTDTYSSFSKSEVYPFIVSSLSDVKSFCVAHNFLQHGHALKSLLPMEILLITLGNNLGQISDGPCCLNRLPANR